LCEKNAQYYAQKHQQNCAFMNSASVLLFTSSLQSRTVITKVGSDAASSTRQQDGGLDSMLKQDGGLGSTRQQDGGLGSTQQQNGSAFSSTLQNGVSFSSPQQQDGCPSFRSRLDLTVPANGGHFQARSR
jgi:hypothetical protein